MLYSIVRGLWGFAVVFLLLETYFIWRLAKKKDPKKNKYLAASRRIYNELVYDDPKGKPEEKDETLEQLANLKGRKAKKVRNELYKKRMQLLDEEFDDISEEEYEAYLLAGEPDNDNDAEEEENKSLKGEEV
jgi:hypothetical protein